MLMLKDRHILLEKTNTKQVMLDILSGIIMKIDVNRYPEILFFFKNKKLIFEYHKIQEEIYCSYYDVWINVNNNKRLDVVSENAEIRKAINSIKENSEKFLRIQCKHLRILDEDRRLKLENHFYPKRWLSLFRL